MAFLRQWLLILFALVLSGESIMAASPTKEQRAYTAAVSAFQDRMWSRAEAQFEQFKKDFPKSINVPMAVLIEAQAEFEQGKFTDAIALLNDTNNLAKAGNLADQYFYWTGEAQFTNRDFSMAANTFVALAANYPASPLRLRSVVEAAAAYMRLDDWPDTIQLLGETNEVFQRAAQMDSANELVSRGRLLLAQAMFAQKDFDGEFAVLNSLNSQTLKPELDWQRAYLLFQNRNAAGDFAATLAAATNLLQIASLEKNNGWIAESVALQADALEKSGLTNEAIAAFQENLTNTAPVAQQRQAVLKIAELAIEQKEIPLATNALETFLAEFPDSPAADVVTLTLGELHLKNYVAQPQMNASDLLEAQTRFDQFVIAFTNSPLLGKAYLDRGWRDWLAWKVSGGGLEISNSLSDFKMAAEGLPFSEDLAVAKFKLGDAMFAQNNFAGARENYESVVNDFTNFPAVNESLGAQALYQLLRASLALNDLNGASNSLARIFEIYPTNSLTENSILLTGEGMTDLNEPANALKVFQLFKEKFPASELLPEDELAMARAYEQQGDWPSAIGAYEGWLERFGTNSILRPPVKYARAWANFQAGNETNAYLLFTNFIAEFPTNGLAPIAQWWVGDHFFRAGDFVDAEKNYKYIFQNTNWQNSVLAYPAKMMAGRAAIGRNGYQDATNYFTSLTLDTNCPPALYEQALFAYGDTLMLMPSSSTNNPTGNFSQAIPVLQTICQTFPNTAEAALAQGKIGDCYLQLANFDAATNAYAQVINATAASASARSQAQIGTGIALEKKAALAAGGAQIVLLNEALDNYSDVLYQNNLRDGEAPDPFWRKSAGLHAAALAETLGNFEVATNVYSHLEELFPQAKDSLEKKMVAAQSKK